MTEWRSTRRVGYGPRVRDIHACSVDVKDVNANDQDM